jgi:hypothetical protein
LVFDEWTVDAQHYGRGLAPSERVVHDGTATRRGLPAPSERLPTVMANNQSSSHG